MIQLLTCADNDQQPTPDWPNDNTCMCLCHCYPGYHNNNYYYLQLLTQYNGTTATKSTYKLERL